MLSTLRMMLDAAPLPQILVAADERVIAANAGAQRLFGSQIEGRHYITVLRAPAILDSVERVLRERKASAAMYPASEAMRDTMWHMTAAPVELSSGVGALITLEDKTALEEAGQIRRDFVANVSHELRTPLTALLGFIETLRGAAKKDPKAQERFLAIMEREAGRMNRLVHDLLSLSRVESEERMRPTEEVDVSALVRSVIVSLRPLAEDRQMRLEVAGADSPHRMNGDADQLCQVFTNLIENGIKYGNPGGRVSVTVTESEREPALRSPAVSIAVEDDGEGIDPVHIPRLTERFYRVDTHRSREMGGTGLGLAIVKHIVNRHRGRLRVESEPGKGSRFTVVLPLRTMNIPSRQSGDEAGRVI